MTPLSIYRGLRVESTQTKKVHQMTRDVHETYDSEFRFLSYWKQIEWCQEAQPTTILYVGVGTGFVSNYLKNNGWKIKTVDIDRELKPDYAKPVTDLSSIRTTFDLIMACEVLEHIPFADVEKALSEMGKIGKRLILSIPENQSKLWFAFKVPLLPETKVVIPLPFFSGKVTSEFHYWELNPSYRSKLETLFEKTGWKITKRERVVKLTTHYFYFLERK